MAKEEIVQYPQTMRTGGRNGRTYLFDQVAPLTGDGIYKTTDDKGIEYHALIPNPDAHDHQARMLLRRP